MTSQSDRSNASQILSSAQVESMPGVFANTRRIRSTHPRVKSFIDVDRWGNVALFFRGIDETVLFTARLPEDQEAQAIRIAAW